MCRESEVGATPWRERGGPPGARLAARFRRDEGGAAAILFAASLVLIIPLIIGVFEVYYGSEQRGKLQDSLDAAALFAARSTAETDEQLTAVGRRALDANLTLEPGATLKSASFVADGDAVIAVARLQPASLLGSAGGLWRYPEMVVRTDVNRSMDKLEIALVLDNTGSMRGTKLSTLKTAAKDLVDQLKLASSRSTKADPVKIALVPFSNTVRVQDTTSLKTYDASRTSNPGIPDWIDPKGRSHQVDGTNRDIFSHPGVDRLEMMRNLQQGYRQVAWEGCVEARPKPYDVENATPTAREPETMYVPYFWPDEPDNRDKSSRFYPEGSGSYFDDGYNDYIDDIPDWSASTDYGTGDIVAFAPPGWSRRSTYAAGDLVQRNGRVYQARSASKNRKPPDSSYWKEVSGGGFWRATKSTTGEQPGSSAAWTPTDDRDVMARELSAAKYGDEAGEVEITRTGYTRAGSGYLYGPNSGCALTPVMRLTADTGAIKSAIDSMTAVGETHIPIGLAWGWNMLSPTEPFPDGADYGAPGNRKIVILMTDGENTMSNPYGYHEPNGSYYGGYGYVWQDLLDLSRNSSGSTRTEAIDERLSQLCSNMKDEGITIYTVRVEVRGGSSDLLEGCATSPDKFYDVERVSELDDAFGAIASSIDNLRISK